MNNTTLVWCEHIYNLNGEWLFESKEEGVAIKIQEWYLCPICKTEKPSIVDKELRSRDEINQRLQNYLTEQKKAEKNASESATIEESRVRRWNKTAFVFYGCLINELQWILKDKDAY